VPLSGGRKGSRGYGFGLGRDTIGKPGENRGICVVLKLTSRFRLAGVPAGVMPERALPEERPSNAAAENIRGSTPGAPASA